MKDNNWQRKENSNATPSIGALGKHIIAEVSKDYWLREVYPEHIAEANVDGDIHIHDLGALAPYCCGYSLEQILWKGVKGIPNIPISKPAKHFDSVLNQLANLCTIFQNEIAGAVAFNSVDTLLAPFIKQDKLTFKEVKQAMQNFVYSINSNSRGGAEPAFSNITLDLTPPVDLIDNYVIIGGELQSFTYRKCQQEMDMFNRAFCEVMLEGDANEKNFAYPIPTYNIHERFDWDNPNNKLLWEMTGKYGTPYFANFLNSDLDVRDIRSMCPLTGDTEVLVKSQEEIFVQTIEKLFDALDMKYQVWNGERWVHASLNRFDKTKVYELTLSNGSRVKMGENHLQPVRGFQEPKQAKGIKVGDWLPYNKNAIPMTSHKLRDGQYDEDDKFLYSMVENIQEVQTEDDYLYCFEVQDDSHLFMLADGLITHNCRLSLDLTELKKKNGGLFGAGDSTGSIGVVTLNLPRIGYEANTKEEFFKILDDRLALSVDSLEIKRVWLEKEILENDLIPAFQEYVGTLENHFSTIGVIGYNEMCMNFFGKDIRDPECHAFCLEVGEHLREQLQHYQLATGHLFNLEATPAESTCYRLAKKDKKKYPDIYTQGEGEDIYYTNSCHIPVRYVDSIFDNFTHQNELQKQFTGGTVIHTYLEGAISGDQAKALVKSLCLNFSVPYISLSPISRYCDEHGYIVDRTDTCPRCGDRLKKYQRITGYLRCVDNFNIGKQAEFNDRVQINLK